MIKQILFWTKLIGLLKSGLNSVLLNILAKNWNEKTWKYLFGLSLHFPHIH